MLDMGEPAMVKIFKLGSQKVTPIDIASFLRGEEDEGYAACTDEIMLGFLNGLVAFKRGENKEASDPNFKPEKHISNNLILKKLRVAFELKDVDMHEIFAKADYQISKPELSALFRKPGHSNYRACGDQILRYFLKGLTLRVRG